MVEAKLAQMISTQGQSNKISEYDHYIEADESRLKDSTMSYGRRRNLPIEQRSQLWLAMKQRKLEG